MRSWCTSLVSDQFQKPFQLQRMSQSATGAEATAIGDDLEQYVDGSIDSTEDFRIEAVDDEKGECRLLSERALDKINNTINSFRLTIVRFYQQTFSF